MNRLLLLIFLFSSVFSYSQTGYLFVKKGIKKKKTYTEGDNIYLRLQNDSLRYGMITRLMNDTIYLSGWPIPRVSVKEVIIRRREKKRFHVPVKDLLLITGGVVLVTGGLTLSDQADFKEALTAGLVMGYGPLAVGYLKSKISLKRKKYRIGKKFRLQVLDFYIPRQRQRAF
ncbi:hypothetical protein [Terrimonas alba]|uniref:hypothetical protein n=1 Tax=Terrimonas alba TaxID=3349636 RepID=UPI0035F43B68